MQRLFLGVILASAVFVLLLGGGYLMGYRVGPGITLVKTHLLTITNLPRGASVFTDYAPRGTSEASTMHITLVPGQHTVLISAKGYWPWDHVVTVPNNTNATVHALMVPKVTSGTLLSGAKAKAARERVAAQTLPSATKPLVLENGCALISLTDTNQIIATPTTTPSCTPPPFLCVGGTCAPTVILSPVKKPTTIVPYPHREDALLIAIGKTVYALSLDPRTPRTFAPVLKGIAPQLTTEQNGTVVVVDKSAAYRLAL